KGVDLTIEKGEFVVFVGPSGCGKSTLLRMIAGLTEIDRGSLHLDGRDITRLPSSKRDLAMVFQSYALYPHMSVADNMSFALRLANVDKAVIRDKVQRAAEILNLVPYLQRTPKELSGGQRQRVAIGRAIVRAPKVFLFVAQFIGTPQMNVIDTTELPALRAAVGATEASDGFIGVRPENVLVRPAGAGHIAGQVELVESLGADTLIYASVGANGNGGVQLVARQNTRSALRPGDAVGLDIAPGSFHLFNRQGQAVARAQ